MWGKKTPNNKRIIQYVYPTHGSRIDFQFLILALLTLLMPPTVKASPQEQHQLDCSRSVLASVQYSIFNFQSNKVSSTSVNNKRIAKNTLLLYFRMLFLMLISLYTSRVILHALGVTDYGIYNVVGGFVSMFALISAALTSACSLFLNYEMGSRFLFKS